ncbi:MAG: efflux RND transporter periplasmic adaptor subunit [Candidatus Sulfotelmatobacter sp.]|jgi:RND family efflux transporter MFP subunit
MPKQDDIPMKSEESNAMAPDMTKAPETSTAEVSETKPPQAKFSRSGLLALIAVAVVVAIVVVFGILSRLAAETRLQQSTDQAAIPSVNVVHPKPGDRAQELVLPGNTQAFIDSPVYARTNGYLKRWYFDIGARVTKGQLLAEIETPELDQQLRQARADLATAEANQNLSQITAARDENLLKTHSVSTQERDNAVNGYAANQATVESNKANVSRLEQLQAYEKVYAPFDGIITARETDIGALIDAGANAPKELFHIASITKLRIYVAVPEVYSAAARNGAPADLTLDEFPGETFRGTLVRNSNSIDPLSRTLLVEVDVENANGRLKPGAYVQVHLKMPEGAHPLVVPANTLLFRRDGLQVGVVRDGKAELLRVTPGHDYGDSMEILSGLQPTDDVILSPSDSLTDGTQVQISGSGSKTEGAAK